MSAQRSIDVCVATFRRPGLLADLLASLAEQNLTNIEMRIVVIDNDQAGSARDVVERFRATSPCDVIYEIEPLQSIALARNRALRKVAGEYFAFVDDDETAPPQWLGVLLSTCERSGSDAVFGPVSSVFPPGAPEWVRRHSVFRRTRRKTGSLLSHGATNNCLVRTRALGDPRHTFDPGYGLTGGEDTDFFYRLHLSGRKFVWCDEAELIERIPARRATLDWVHRRSYRSGQSFSRIFVTRYRLASKSVWLARKVVQLVGALVAVPFARVISYPAFTEITAAAYRTVGQLSVFFGRAHYEEYDAGRYT